MSVPPKPYTSIPFQVQRLQSLGMTIGDVARAERCLSRIGYYRLGTYWHPFRELDTPGPTPIATDRFLPGTTFEEVVDFYVFDKELRLLVSDGLERIEIALRAQISELLGARDRLAHRNPQELDGSFSIQPSRRETSKTRHADWLENQDKNFDRSKEDFVKNYKKKNGLTPPPIWVAKEVWDWGLLSHFYSGMKTRDQKTIARLYGKISAPQMESWIRQLNDIRDYCAHHSRLWNRGIVNQPKPPDLGLYPAFDNVRNDANALGRLYAALLVMSLMIRVLHPQSQWADRLIQLLRRAPKHQHISYQAAGFPENWQKFGFL